MVEDSDDERSDQVEGAASQAFDDDDSDAALIDRPKQPPPDLSKLPRAVITREDWTRELVARAADTVIFNMYAKGILPDDPFIRTVKGRITKIKDNGIVRLIDSERLHMAAFDWREIPVRGDEVRFPAGFLRDQLDEQIALAAAALEAGDVELAVAHRAAASRIEAQIALTDSTTVAKRKIGRPRRERSPEELAADKERSERRARGELRRGRPKGTLNRPKEVIEREKAARADERKKKKQGRAS